MTQELLLPDVLYKWQLIIFCYFLVKKEICNVLNCYRWISNCWPVNSLNYYRSTSLLFTMLNSHRPSWHRNTVRPSGNKFTVQNILYPAAIAITCHQREKNYWQKNTVSRCLRNHVRNVRKLYCPIRACAVRSFAFPLYLDN